MECNDGMVVKGTARSGLYLLVCVLYRNTFLKEAVRSRLKSSEDLEIDLYRGRYLGTPTLVASSSW